MLYENYRGKIIKVKEMLQTVWRFRILIFSLLAFALVSLGTFFGVYGMVYEVTPNIETLSYGQEIGYSANAVFGSVRYEYALQGSDEWSEIQPVRAGSYKVRAVSRNIFGGNRYGKEYAFVISPKQIDVVIDVESFVYGGIPQVSAPLEYGDTLTCTQFSYEDITSPYTKVVAEEESVRIYDASGEDVTYCYSIRPVARLISFVKREISVVVQDKSGIYDGTPLRFDGYELDESTPLAAGDSIVAVFEDTITEVGETENLPSIKVLHREEGETFDVTVNYSIKITAGKLTVEKRPLRISTPDCEKVYDASPLSLAEGYTLAEECSLVEGHSLCVVEAPSITQAGSAENILLFAVLDEDGRDVTKNYSVFLDVGTLTVTPRPVTIETATNTWVYDGTAHSDEEHWVAEESEYELAEGHTSKSSDLSKITDAGSLANEMSIAISDAEGRDVTANYEITLINGTLTVTPRPVIIETATNTWVYDGMAHSDGEHWVAEESEYELVAGHTSTSFDLSEITDVGNASNEMSIAISDAEGRDVTANYEITFINGTLTVTPRPVTIETATDTWVYDGTAHSNGQHWVAEESEYELAEGHTSASFDLSEITDVETLANEMSISISDAEGKDVTANYEITFINGTLTVTPRPVTIKTSTNTWVYDGTAHSDGKHWIAEESEYELVQGHTSKSSDLSEITDVGSTSNEMSIAISDAEGRDVTANYEITLINGTLTVTPRPVTIETATNTWVYDGTAHSDGEHWVAEESEYELAEGHTSSSFDLSEITDVGSASNEMSIAISDAEGRDVSANYEITLINGTLTVTPRPVIIETATNTWVYDGTAHSDGTHWVAEESEYELAKGHTSSSFDLSEITDVGSIANEMSIAISDAEGRDVTANYEITLINGTLTVTSRPVTIETATNTWVYDGTAHSDGTHWVAEESEYELVAGHTSTSFDLSEITDAGTLANEMSIAISDAEGKDVTENYEITFINGTLTVTPRPVIIETATNTWVYDGTAHSDGEHWVAEESEYELVAGHTSTSFDLSEITDAGTLANEMSIAISDAEGKDVTANYEITFINGTLTVTPRPVIIETATNTWVYDGTAHSDGKHWVAEESEYELAEGHTSASFDLSEITDVGTLANEMSISISDAEGRDVSANYEITLINGTLTVTPRPVIIETATNTWVYDGTAHSDGTHWVAEESEYELVAGHTSKSSDLSEITNVGTLANEMSIAISDAEGRDVTANYEITFINGTLTVTPRPVMIETATNTWVYDGTAHSDGEHWVAEESEYELVAGHTSKSSDLSEITDVGSIANEMSIAISDAEGRDVTVNYAITFINGTLTVTPRSVIIETATNTWVYDGTAHSDGEHWVAEESEYELVAGHTSKSSDLSEITDVGTLANEMSIVISDAEGRDVTKNYKITFINGTLTVTPRPITVTANSDKKEYDGTPLICDKFTVTSELEWALVSWHEIEAEVVGSQTDVGESANKVVAVHIYDGEEEKTDNYAITTADGKLCVYARSITVIAGSAKKVYDGTELTCNLYRLFKSEGEALVLDHKEKVVIAGSQTEVGESSNVVVSVQIYSADKEVTSNYAITCEEGTLLVTPRPVTIETATNTWVYDGTAHSDGTHWVAEESEYELAKGHTSSSFDLSEITDVGTLANEMSIAISDAEGRDVTANYEITFINGTLTVTPRPVTIETATNTWVYDGTAHSDGEHWVAEESEYELVAGHTSKSSDLSEITDAGSIANEMSIAISDAEGRDVTVNYEITFINGTLTVTPRPVIIETATNTWVYDGTAHSDGEHWVAEESEYELVAGHTSTSFDLSEITDAGTLANEMSIAISDAEGRDVTANYAITFINGTLTVTPRPITVTANSDEKEYDGTPLICDKFTVTSELEWALVSWHEIEAEVVGSQTEIGESANKVASVHIYDGERDVTDNYSITCVSGTLRVIPRPVLFTTASANWLYDGTAHSDGDHWVSEASICNLLEGHRSVSSQWAQIREIGSTENTMVITILDSDGSDVTKYYNVMYDCGTLRVVFAKVFVRTESAEKVYDGTELTCNEYSLETEFAPGYESAVIEVTCTGAITNVGDVENTFTIRVLWEGTDRKKDVEVTFELGILSILPRPVTITTQSGEWEYDGKEHSLPGVEVSAGEYDGNTYEILPGHTYSDTDYASITNPGQEENSCTFLIFDASSNDVTDNYEIIADFGTLTVLGGGGGGGNGDLDTSGNIGGGGGSGGDSVVAVRVLSDADGSIYLRLTSYGDLNNAETKWEAAVPYEDLLDGKYSYNYLSGIALENAGYPRLDVSVDVIGTCYYLPYYMATGEDDYLIQQSDVLYEGSTDQVYSLNYFLYDITLDGTIGDTLGQYAEEELAYRNWVKGHYMQIDLSAQLREYFDRVIEQNGWREEKDTALLIAEVASFIQGAATYNLQYDTALDSSTDIVYDFLQVYEEGICQHYATAATVLLRYLGIPARYTIGYVGSTSAGEWTEITTANAHAWVEAYVEGFGWVQVEVTGGGPGGGGGGGGGSGEKLVLKPADAWKQYDGKELVATKVEGADTESKLMLYDYLARGYTYQAVFSGSQTEVGTGKSEIVSFVLYDPSGKKVQDISRVFLPGNLTVVENTLVTICPYSLQKVYDGKPLAYGANDYYVRGLPQGWRVEYSLEGVELTDAGVIGYKNFSKKTLKVYGADGSLLTEGEDYFAVFDTDSALVVTKRKITLSSASASKEYDGLPLVKDSVWISSGALADGQVLTANAVGKIVDIGKVENKIKNIVISDENGANVGRNYVVTLSNGWLIVV